MGSHGNYKSRQSMSMTRSQIAADRLTKSKRHIDTHTSETPQASWAVVIVEKAEKWLQRKNI